MAKLHILSNGVLLKASQIALDFSGGGVVVTADPNDPDRVNVVVAGGGGPSAAVDVSLPIIGPIVVPGSVVYVNPLGQVALAGAFAVGPNPAIGIVTAIAAGIATVRVAGLVSGFGYGLPTGGTAWLGVVAGTVSALPAALPGEVVQRLGISLGPVDTLVLPDLDFVVL